MVDDALLERTIATLPGRPRRILVTGGSGFVGSHLARCLAEAGHQVTVLSRNRYRTRRILHPNIRHEPLDIQDAAGVERCCAGQEWVYHAAALTTPWGDQRQLHAVNVAGTENVVRACRTQGVLKLIHLSSTSVHFNYQDLDQHRDDAPFPVRPACHYSASKQQAEHVVRQAAEDGLATFTIRARAVFGEGDNALLPRLIQAARDGRLRQIGDGRNRVDLTYIDNLVFALVLAAVRGRSGGVCTITNGEPILLWKLLPRILAELNIPFTGKRVSYRAAYLAAAVGEAVHWAWPRLGEPKLTRYTVGLLAKNQVFDLQAAVRELDYAPIVSMDEGIRRATDALKRREEAPSKTSVSLRCFTTGYAVGDQRIVERSAPRAKLRFHALVGLLDHPTQGLTLFDTGYAPRLLALRGAAAWVLNTVAAAHTSDQLSMHRQLHDLGIEPGDVRRVILSHFHPDHVAGLKDFPDADLITSRTAWEAIRGRKGWRALRCAVLPDLLPGDLSKRLHLLESFSDPGLGPFDHCHDLFGDGSLRLFELPGHAAGQLGALIQTEADGREFLVADAAWTTAAIRNQEMPSNLTRIFIHSFSALRRTIEQLHECQRQFPEIRLLPTHCPEVAAEFGFDEQVAAASNRKQEQKNAK